MKKILFLIFLLLAVKPLFAQNDTTGYVYDSFFLAKKKGVWGRLGKSIAVDKPKPELVKTGTIKNNLPFNRYAGFFIRQIHIVSLELNQDINDTTSRRRNFFINIANKLHRKTREQNIRNNLFFSKGDKIYPYLLADNERHLREQPYLQDARISLATVAFNDSIDVYVYTKDVFSIGGSLNISGTNNFDAELRDENFLGNTTRVAFKVLYDETRGPATGYGGEVLQRNIAGSFTDVAVGFKSFNTAFSSGRPEETYTYINLNRPLVSAYMSFTGNIDLSWHKTSNAYVVDSIYKKELNYEYTDFDAWCGYNLGRKKLLNKNIQKRIREFFAVRVLHHQFQQVPGLYQNSYNYVYADITGVLGAVNIFKQNFYKTKYIYGFGRQEDVPEGFSLSLIGGWTDKQKSPKTLLWIGFYQKLFWQQRQLLQLYF